MTKRILLILSLTIICVTLFSQKKVDKTLILNKKTGEYVNHTITEELYKKSQKVKENLYKWDEYKNRWAYVEYKDYEYNDDTLRIETQYGFYAPDSVWQPLIRTEFSYKNDTVFENIYRYNNYVDKIQDWDIFQKAKSLTRKDGKTAWRHVDILRSDKKAFSPYEATDFEYNSKGLLQKKCVTSFAHSCGAEPHGDHYEADSHQDHSEELFFIEYFYDKKGKLKESVFIDTAHKKINMNKFKHLQE